MSFANSIFENSLLDTLSAVVLFLALIITIVYVLNNFDSVLEIMVLDFARERFSTVLISLFFRLISTSNHGARLYLHIISHWFLIWTFDFSPTSKSKQLFNLSYQTQRSISKLRSKLPILKRLIPQAHLQSPKINSNYLLLPFTIN